MKLEIRSSTKSVHTYYIATIFLIPFSIERFNDLSLRISSFLVFLRTVFKVAANSSIFVMNPNPAPVSLKIGRSFNIHRKGRVMDREVLG